MREIMRFENVKKIYKDGHEIVEALKSTSFSIYAGELVAIIGPSGSGKSTLLTIMGGLQKPSKGHVFFNGENLFKHSDEVLNKLRFDKIGFVLQQSNLIPFLSIKEQFEFVDVFAKRKVDKKKANNLMKMMDIYKRRNLFPSDLSGGERQRAAICRALYTDPLLLLADEPTANLDTKRAIQVVEILKKSTKEFNRTTVMVTHDDRLLKYFDRIFKIVDGILIEEKIN